MATQTFTGIIAQSDTPAFLGETDNAEVQAGAFLACTTAFNSAIWSTGSNQTIDVYGTIYAVTYSIQAGSNDNNSTNQTINIYSGASVLAGGGIVISGTNSTLTNAGTISGAYGLYYHGAASGDGGTITNSGIISANGDEDYYAAIYNSGEEKLTTVNTGMLRGSVYAYVGSVYEEAVDDLTNSGWISGNVKFGGGDDRYDGRLGTITGAIYGEAGNDTLLGGTGAETLDGGSGNDALDGGAGADTMSGGAGDDTYTVDNSGDSVAEDADAGTDTVNASVTFTLSDYVENLILTGSLAINGTGNALANILSGNAANNSLFGLAGADTLSGGNGNDTLSGGAGADTLTGGAGNDALDGGTEADAMTGGGGNDVYSVDNRGDVVTEAAGEGTDTVRASISLTLGANVETLILTGSTAMNGTGNTLNNAMTGNAAANTLSGLAGNDTLTGLAGIDTLKGGDGNDTLKGGADNDLLTGGLGADRLYGEAGADSFIFTAFADSTVAASGRDTIYDFSQAQDDVINLASLDAKSTVSGNQTFSFIGETAFTGAAGQLRYANSRGDSFVYGDTNGDKLADFSIKVEGTIDFVAGDFLL